MFNSEPLTPEQVRFYIQENQIIANFLEKGLERLAQSEKPEVSSAGIPKAHTFPH